jgi:DNA gyrase subunit A
MTQQLSIAGFGASKPDPSVGRIIPTNLQEEMQRSYLEYAMSVIVGRALPDVRDGLKPVHRRILYAMHELGLTPDRPFRKCARVVGDVLGKYHPHGDQAVYDALVRMVQDFSSRYPLVEGHGNFGSVDNDPPAAMRYTECRLAGLGNSGLLAEIGEDIVEFMPNFDGSQAEPTILPARLPILLLNGSSGIAVGMATNIPPHNLGELVEGLLALIDRPDITAEELMQSIPAPDFPTGGEILGNEGILDTYRHGRGSITLRGVAQFEEIQPGKGRHRRPAIVISEFPYQVNKAAWIEKVAELVNQDRITGIADLRDESDRSGIRVVVELRREANPQAVLQQLYKLTPLQTTFGAILLALVNGEPQQLGLKPLLQHFLEFRIATLTRVFQAELDRVQQKSEEIAGMLLALQDLDRVIDLLRRAPDGSAAKLQLQDLLQCTPAQADTILAMPLRRLTGMERERLQQEHETLLARIAELQELLQHRSKLLTYLKKELRSLKKAHADPRRTLIKTQADLQAEEAQVPEEADGSAPPMILQFTRKGYVRRLPVTNRRARTTGKDLPSTDDPVVQTITTQLDREVLILTTAGRAFTLTVEAIPQSTAQSRGTPLVTLLPAPEPVVQILSLEPDNAAADLVLLSQQGRIKRVPLLEFTGLTARGTTAMKLKEGDELGWAVIYQAHAAERHSLVIATSGGRLLRLALHDDQIPVMGRTAMGNAALRLHRKEAIVGMAVVKLSGSLLLGSEQGYFKRLAVMDVPLVERGAIGIQSMQFKTKSDVMAHLMALPPEGELTLLMNTGECRSVPIPSVPMQDRAGKGTALITATGQESVIGIQVIETAVHSVGEPL